MSHLRDEQVSFLAEDALHSVAHHGLDQGAQVRAFHMADANQDHRVVASEAAPIEIRGVIFWVSDDR
ncbi:hypothetical protein [Thioalkalivibrio sp. ALM2T]|uniref:hypothetical protein n=1 Tax=Thioalkalivibrio sp. ALM2T TaxID=1158184 RepID=UPI0003694511|nr:hypothetical protein [Thioalkalivibrio sp. ALM2T]